MESFEWYKGWKWKEVNHTECKYTLGITLDNKFVMILICIGLHF